MRPRVLPVIFRHRRHWRREIRDRFTYPTRRCCVRFTRRISNRTVGGRWRYGGRAAATGLQVAHDGADRWPIAIGLGGETTPAVPFASHVHQFVGSVGRCRRNPVPGRQSQNIVSDQARQSEKKKTNKKYSPRSNVLHVISRYTVTTRLWCIWSRPPSAAGSWPCLKLSATSDGPWVSWALSSSAWPCWTWCRPL